MKKLGTFGGVFVPSFEAILGAVLFLILPLLVGAVAFWNTKASGVGRFDTDFGLLR